MASLTFTFDDAVAPRLLDAVCGAWGYESKKQPGESKVQFVKRLTREKWIADGAAFEASNAAQAVSDSQTADFKNSVQIT